MGEYALMRRSSPFSFDREQAVGASLQRIWVKVAAEQRKESPMAVESVGSSPIRSNEADFSANQVVPRF